MYMYQTAVITFEETKIVDKYSIVQRKSWCQRKAENELVFKQREYKESLQNPQYI